MIKNSLKNGKIWRIMKSNKGTSFPLVIAITLSLLMIFVGISEYMRLVIIAGGVRDAVQSAIINTVNDNYRDVYHSTREGYAAGYQPSGTSFTNSVNYGDVYAYLDKTLGLSVNGGEHIKTAGTDTEFKVYGLSVEIQNAPIAPSTPATSQKFIADAIIDLEVPVRFGNKLLPPMRIKLKVQAEYTEMF